MMNYYVLNPELNGIEVYFDEKPGDIIRDNLKSQGFRWSGRKKCWYAKQTDDRLEWITNLMERRAEAQEQIKSEIKAQKKTVALTIESMNQAAKGYTVKETGEGMYSGWTGCNYNYKGGKDLKNAIVAELKKNGIKCTGRTGKSTYTDSFTFTVTVPENFKMSEDEYADEMTTNSAGYFSYNGWNWFIDLSGKEWNYKEFDDMPFEDVKRICREHFIRIYRERKEVQPKAEFKKFVKTIVNSFNQDHSNSMIDYFDVGFYADYNWK